MLSGSSRVVALLGSLVGFLLMLAASASAHETTLHGLVLAVIPGRGEIVVRHEALFGKPAGISTFRVASPSMLGALRAGETIDATADADSTPWTLGAIHGRGTGSLTGAATEDAPPVLRDVHHVVVGEYAPTPQLLDERNAPFSLRDLRGQSVVLAFVYTRCKDARECPLITSRFAALQHKFGGSPVHLVEVTLDPVFDRPAVLARYGATFGEEPSRWTLVTGKPETVLDFAAQFDVTAFPDERVGLIHPERLVLLDKYGAIRELVDEGAWTPDEVVAEVRHDERLASNPFERLDLWLSSAAVAVCGNAVAGFSGFTDLLTVIGISAFFAFLLWRLGRFIARGAT
jgi:protein SCO1/2